MKNSKGFTLIELMVVIFIIAILIAIVGGKIAGWTNVDKEACEYSMIQYVKTIDPSLYNVTASCSNKDSDGNGYVRCTGAGTNSKEERVTMIAECDDEGNCAPIQGVDR